MRNSRISNQVDVKPVENKIDSAKAVTGEQEKNATTKTDTLLKADPAKDPVPPIVKIRSFRKKMEMGIAYYAGHFILK